MKEHIKHWYPKDERFFKVLSIAGNIRQEDAGKIDISASRLKNMESLSIKGHLCLQRNISLKYF